MQLDTHEHFSKSRNFAESDKTISSSVVKMKSVLQVTMTLIWKKIIIVLRYIPKAKHIRHLEHDTQQGNKNYKYRKGIEWFSFPLVSKPTTGYKTLLFSFSKVQNTYEGIKQSKKSTKINNKKKKKKLLRERIYQGIQQFKDINFSLAE